MRHYFTWLFLGLWSLVCASCNKDERVIQLLNSKAKEDVILGAYKAGEAADKMFVPLLLKNAYDLRTSTNPQFKGISVYQSKMIALEKIFRLEPPVKITDIPDSTIIKFYTKLYKQSGMQN